MNVILLQLENEKCGCNSRCSYNPDRDLIKIDGDIPPQQLPCTVLNTIKLIQEIIRDIQNKRRSTQ